MVDVDEKYMARALELARHAEGNASPNPMVGAVIVSADGRIIGEGYHRRCGEGHAEVNAIASVKTEDRRALANSTMYVTLEPCSHYGKTPPCAKLIVATGIPRVVVGAADPFKEVAGRGIAMLRNAGIEVIEGVMSDESRRLNKRFMTAHEEHRPYVTLKWAQSSDGFMDWNRPDNKPFIFSDSLNATLVHRLRSLHDAILVGSQTIIDDNPRLDCRLWPGRSPRPVVVDRRHRINPEEIRLDNPLIINDCNDIASMLRRIYEQGITSVLVEGGPTLLNGFIEDGLWDEARVETAPLELGESGRAQAPKMPIKPYNTERVGRNKVDLYSLRQ